jgi:single-strand DNA-binding protein
MNLNKVFILGNLTRDPELRQTAGGQAVCSFGVATNRRYTDKAGQKQEQVEFHNLVAWGRTAEVIAQYIRKGSMILVEGRLQTRSWQDQQGVKHWKTEVIVDTMQMGPRGGTDGQGGSAGGGNWNKDRNNEGNQSSPPMQDQKSPPEEQTPIIDIADEGEEIDVKDIPF